MSPTRPAAVAGLFYPAEPARLRREVAQFLARADAPAGERAPKLLVLPHAGYVYSGACAANGVKLLARWRERFRRVVLLAPAHRVAVRSLAAPTVDAFETPLGRIPLDHTALAALDDLPQVQRSDRAHAQEHAVEVQLPFLQAVLGDGFTLVPLVVGGRAAPHEVAEVLQRLWGGDETLIIISTDLSHYLTEAEARVRDRATIDRILHFDTGLAGDEACGAAALNGALQLARESGLEPRLLDLRTSADSPEGDSLRVVGYGALAFEPHADNAIARDDEAGQAASGEALLAAAHQAIAEALGLAPAPLADPPALQSLGATFVSLHTRDGRLRGCVGRLEATRPLGEDVRDNARCAAFHDGRFAPLRLAEWEQGLQIEVSVLGPSEPIVARDEATLLATLRPGIDGVILDWRGTRATFLPQVWEDLPDPATFLRALKRKAGLAPDFWSPELQVARYGVQRFGAPPAPGSAESS